MELDIDESVKPVIQSYRRLAAPLEERVNKKISDLLAADIIEPYNGPCRWVSAMVVEPKKDGDIRICIDMRMANKAIRKEPYPLPTVEEIYAKVGRSKFFSLLDIRQAFHQVELGDRSRYITAFITSKGIFQYKRLLFGVACAPEKFQKIMQTIVAGCEGCAVYIDDILIFGRNKEEHDLRLQKVLKRLRDHEVLLNEQKCKYGVTEVEFLGMKLSERGVDIAADKLKAVREMREPQNVSELRSFLGYVNFMKGFVPEMSTMVEPLNMLLRTNAVFQWKREQADAFGKLKAVLCDARTLGYYLASDYTEVIADASPVGLGAVLVQKHKDEDFRVIGYASRSLSPAERRYAQTEKEALAIVWSVERFHYYLYGKHFFVITDHRPLEIIFGPRSRPCLRIERWVLRLSSYDFDVKYRPGKNNIADPFSRMSVGEGETESFDEISESWIRHIAEVSRPRSIMHGELEEESKKDELIQKIKAAVHSGEWEDDAVKTLALIKNEFCFHENILLRGSRIVIPTSLRERTLKLAHCTHAGETVMKQVLRTKVWWPGMDKEVTAFVKQCRECLLTSLPGPPEPLQRKELPMAPWIDVATDFLGPFPSGEYLLIVIDYYSRYQEIEIVTSTAAAPTVAKFKRIFGRAGYPRTLIADNGPPFNSAEFQEYCDEVGVILKSSTPYWPQQNGEVERQNRDVLKFIRCSHSSGRNWKDSIHEYMLMKNTSVNSTTGKSPSDLFFNREIRNRVPSIVQTYEGCDDEVRDRDREMKYKGKIAADTSRRARKSSLEPGDHVVVKNFKKTSKLDTNFAPEVHKIIERKGGEVVVENVQNHKQYRRNVAHLKRMGMPMGESSPDSVRGLGESSELDMQSTSNGNRVDEGCPSEKRPKRMAVVPMRYRD